MKTQRPTTMFPTHSFSSKISKADIQVASYPGPNCLIQSIAYQLL
ncbi:BgTH12-02371 [Blumeria graminis f. sp. triticale]|uniref:BgTH12-02371 n=1 Tax=Blumeria graminis f. sp. triticale TaxID=1689686 RepID=A0A9W4GFR7_BLUGR|nr:BgTH12-02371 [Blumeria graminis f. sp. triticale]